MSTDTRIGFCDLPIHKAEDDSLQLGPHADALANFAKYCDTPMTIAVQGDWGTGKTSLMNLIKQKLDAIIYPANEKGDDGPYGESNKYLGIWFNTWQYSQFGNDENLPASLLLNLLAQINQVLRAEPLPSNVGDIIKKLVKSIIGAISVTAKIGETEASFSGKSLLDEYLDTGSLDRATHFGSMKMDFATLIAALKEHPRQRKSNSGWTGSTVQLKPYDRVVVYIDDLDRLPPAKAVELLEVIKNIIDVPGCVFILAIDYAVVVSGLHERKGYKPRNHDADDDESRKFFDKIIQVPYRIPSANYKLKDLLGRLAEHSLPHVFIQQYAGDIIGASVGHNPRALKRALNIHALFAQLINEQAKGLMQSRDDVRWRELTSALAFVFACIQVSMPALYDSIATAKDPACGLLALMLVNEVLALAEPGNDNAEANMRAHLEVIYKSLEADKIGSLMSVVRDLGASLREKNLTSEIARKRIGKVAARCFEFIGAQEGLDDEACREAIRAAVMLSRATATDDQGTGDDQDISVSSHFFGFMEISAVFPDLFKENPPLFFSYPDHNLPAPIWVTPAYGRSFKHIMILDEDGQPRSLASKTKEVLRSLKDGGVSMTDSEINNSSPFQYWFVEASDGRRHGLDTIRQAYQGRVEASSADTREAATAAYDQQVLECMSQRPHEPVQNSTIRDKVGGSEQEVRRAFERLLERGLISRHGERRGTTYTLRGKIPA